MAGIASSLESRQALPGLAVAEAGSAGGGKGLASLFDATLSGLMPPVAPHDELPPELPLAASAAGGASLPAATPDPAAAASTAPVLTPPAIPVAPAAAAAPTPDPVAVREPRVAVAPEPAARPAVPSPVAQLAPPSRSAPSLLMDVPVPAKAVTAPGKPVLPQPPAMPAATLSARMTAAVPAGTARPVRIADADIEAEDPITADAAVPDNLLPMPAAMPMAAPLTSPSQLPADASASALPRAALADSIASASRGIRPAAVAPASASSLPTAEMGRPAASAQAAKPAAAVAAESMAALTVTSDPSFARAFANASAVVAPASPRLAEKPAAVTVAATPVDVSAQIIPGQPLELPRLAASGSQAPVALAHTPLQDPAWAQAAGQRLAWMVQGGESTAVLAINPESLGPIHVRIHMDGQSARIDLAAQQPMTATLLESHLPRLTAALENQGVRVDELRVGNQALAGDFAAWQGASGGSGQQAAAGEQGARQSRWFAGSASTASAVDVPAAAIARQASDDGRVDDFA